MKRLLSLLAIPVLLALVVTPALAQSLLPITTDLIADGRGDAPDVGDLSVAADGTVTFQIDEAATDWLLDETHLYVGDEAPSKSAPGKFNYKSEELGGVAAVTYDVDLAAADENGDGIVYIAAHAALIMEAGIDPDTGEMLYETESAWAQGDEAIGKGKNWATCFAVDLAAEATADVTVE